MIRTKKILRLLTDAPNLTVAQVAEKLGIPEQKAGKALSDMKRHGYLESRPTTYFPTEHGRAWVKVEPKASRERMDRIVAQRREKRALSISGIPNSVFALGSM